METLMTKKEVCEFLRISQATLDRIVAGGELRAMKVGGSVRFMRSDLSAYLARCAEVAAPKPEPRRRGKKITRPQGRMVYIPGMKVV